MISASIRLPAPPSLAIVHIDAGQHDAWLRGLFGQFDCAVALAHTWILQAHLLGRLLIGTDLA